MPNVSADTTGSVQQCLGLLGQLIRAARTLRVELARAAEPLEISDTQALLLYHCRDASPGMAQRELAAALGISPAQVSGLVEQLRVRGLIEGRRPANDRRRQVWRLADEGRAVLDQLMAGLTPWASQLMATLVNDGLHRLSADIERLATAADAIGGTPMPEDEPSGKRGAA